MATWDSENIISVKSTNSKRKLDDTIAIMLCLAADKFSQNYIQKNSQFESELLHYINTIKPNKGIQQAYKSSKIPSFLSNQTDHSLTQITQNRTQPIKNSYSLQRYAVPG